MTESIQSVREMQPGDIVLIVDYWLHADPAFLKSMGVDLKKIPTKEKLTENLHAHINTPIEQRMSYCMIWLLDGIPVGHSNTNPTIFGKHAFMHLHLWNTTKRKKGMGFNFVKMTLPCFFDKLQLETIYCEPYALNPAPNMTLQKAGFDFVKEYTTTPGSLNFEQPVKRWQLSREKFMQQR